MEEKRSIFSPDTKFARFMNVLADILITGIFWILCCIPLITIVTSTTAAYYSMAKCARHSAGRVTREFFKCFRENFKQSVVIGIPFVVAVALIAFDMLFLWNNSNSVNDALFIAMILVAFVVLGIMVYYPAVLSRFADSNINILKMSAVLMFRFLPMTVGVIVFLALCVIGIYLMPWAVLVLPGVFLYVCTFPMERILRRISPERGAESVSEDDRAWYDK